MHQAVAKSGHKTPELTPMKKDAHMAHLHILE